MKIEYITTRILENSKGEKTGKIRIVKFKEKELADVIFKCPECGNEQKSEEKFKKPFFYSCKKCGHKVKIISLRTEIKKSLKKGK